MQWQKKLIERAYIQGRKLGLSVWCEDEAGPFSTAPYPGSNWRPVGKPTRQEHEYIRNGTAKAIHHPKRSLRPPAGHGVRALGTRSSTVTLQSFWG